MPTGSPKTTAPAAAPTSGSRFTNAPALSAETRACPYAKSVDGASVPTSASPAVASRVPAPPAVGGVPSVTTATGRVASAAMRNCTAVTATGSRPGSRRACATVNEAERTSDARTRPSPLKVAPPPPPAATRPTPTNDTAKPVQATGRATLRCRTAAMTATSTGVAPTSRAAWVTLVRVIPAFCTRIDPPYPNAPHASTAGLHAARTRNRTAARSTAAARPNRATVSQPGGSHSRASLVTGTVVPQSRPAAASAATAVRRSRFMGPSCRMAGLHLPFMANYEIIDREMAVDLDDVDIRLLTALQGDADRTNVELARLVGLSPAATLHRVRRLKESGVIRVIAARLDPTAAGFPLHVYVAASLARHDPRSTRVFEDQVRAIPQITGADNVAGEMDYLLTIVARDVAELQQVLARLATRGGQRLVTYLRLEEVKPPSPLPLVPTPSAAPRARRTRSPT